MKKDSPKMQLFIFFIACIGSAVVMQVMQAEEVSEDIIEEWDNKEIDLNASAEHEKAEALQSAIISERIPNHPKPTKLNQRAPRNPPINNTRNKATKAEKSKPVKQSSPITRPILYRYIYLNPRAEALKAKARLKEKERKKAISEAKK